MPVRNLIDYPPFTRLTVIERGPNTPQGDARWWCDCLCGTSVLVLGKSLITGHTRSCGCLNQEVQQARRTKHGLISVPEYAIWVAMNQRCTNPHAENYARYGGRGITVCDAWRTSFLAFYTDMGPRTGPTYTLERKNNDAPYEKSNCLWATPHAQSRNKRSNRWLTYNGRTQCLKDWADELHIDSSALRWRLRKWSLEKALTTPIQTQYQR